MLTVGILPKRPFTTDISGKKKKNKDGNFSKSDLKVQPSPPTDETARDWPSAGWGAGVKSIMREPGTSV